MLDTHVVKSDNLLAEELVDLTHLSAVDAKLLRDERKLWLRHVIFKVIVEALLEGRYSHSAVGGPDEGHECAVTLCRCIPGASSQVHICFVDLFEATICKHRRLDGVVARLRKVARAVMSAHVHIDNLFRE